MLTTTYRKHEIKAFWKLINLIHGKNKLKISKYLIYDRNYFIFILPFTRSCNYNYILSIPLIFLEKKKKGYLIDLPWQSKLTCYSTVFLYRRIEWIMSLIGIYVHPFGPELFISLVMTNYTVPLQASSSPKMHTNSCHFQPIRHFYFNSCLHQSNNSSKYFFIFLRDDQETQSKRNNILQNGLWLPTRASKATTNLAGVRNNSLGPFLDLGLEFVRIHLLELFSRFHRYLHERKTTIRAPALLCNLALPAPGFAIVEGMRLLDRHGYGVDFGSSCLCPRNQQEMVQYNNSLQREQCTQFYMVGEVK